MGLHDVNMALVGDGDIDVTKPEIVLCEPTADGGIRITGADYFTNWNPNVSCDAFRPGGQSAGR